MTPASQGTPTVTTILVVEDDDDTREFFAFLLTDAGYHVIEAASGTAALAQLANRSIDAALLDRRLPDMDGIDICRHIRSQLGAALPIIMVTADRDPQLEAAVRMAGANDFLYKPVLPEMLLARLQGVR